MTFAKSTSTVEHYTPLPIVEAVRSVFGGTIHLDPASTPRVNAATVRALRIFTKKDDGLAREWCARTVFLNPPGGRVGNRGAAAMWWEKLVDEWYAGRTREAIFLGFSIEILQTAQAARVWPGAFPFCVPRARVQFLREKRRRFVPGDSPTQGNVIVYLPPPGIGSIERFRAAFESFGKVRA